MTLASNSPAGELGVDHPAPVPPQSRPGEAGGEAQAPGPHRTSPCSRGSRHSLLGQDLLTQYKYNLAFHRSINQGHRAGTSRQEALPWPSGDPGSSSKSAADSLGNEGTAPAAPRLWASVSPSVLWPQDLEAQWATEPGLKRPDCSA